MGKTLVKVTAQGNRPTKRLRPSVDLEKKYTCQKGFLVVKWAQIYNQSLATIVYRASLMHAVFQRKATDWAA